MTKQSKGKETYCGCCGRKANAGEWCKRCAKHVDPKRKFWDATYIAIHGEHCPYQVSRNIRERN